MKEKPEADGRFLLVRQTSQEAGRREKQRQEPKWKRDGRALDRFKIPNNTLIPLVKYAEHIPPDLPHQS